MTVGTFLVVNEGLRQASEAFCQHELMSPAQMLSLTVGCLLRTFLWIWSLHVDIYECFNSLFAVRMSARIPLLPAHFRLFQTVLITRGSRALTNSRPTNLKACQESSSWPGGRTCWFIDFLKRRKSSIIITLSTATMAQQRQYFITEDRKTK